MGLYHARVERRDEQTIPGANARQPDASFIKYVLNRCPLHRDLSLRDHEVRKLHARMKQREYKESACTEIHGNWKTRTLTLLSRKHLDPALVQMRNAFVIVPQL